MRLLLLNGRAPFMHPPEVQIIMVMPFAGDKKQDWHPDTGII